MSKKKYVVPKNTRFEEALAELEGVVRTLEGGELPLEQSLEDFERGIALARFCQQQLSDADRKVQALLEEGGEQTLTDLDGDDA
ncbi:exodeoxyribonuclease VII small subunit [Granulosicoccaceae sp. 1_MG-2023]|nr:exodeoxyribonuclease VII small subunit [Granulosicoccaceae sp. 1_MG-2023]